MTPPRLTDAQRRALKYLATVRFASPTEIGAGMGGTKTNHEQGLRRLGGKMAKTLMDKGWAVGMSGYRSGLPAYGITAKGRNALDDANQQKADRHD